METEKNILIVAGEASGDLHAASLVHAIKESYPGLNFFGLGGKRLKLEGVDLYCDLVELAVVGFWEVLKNLKKFRSIFYGLLQETDKVKPDLAILVDYPGFNLRLAKELKKRGTPIIYYISPQVWAWGAGRIKAIKQLVERMIVILNFEEPLYKNEGIPVSFVGHPLLDTVKLQMDKAALFKKMGLDLNSRGIALLPGSREKEVKKILPVMLETAGIIRKSLDENICFLILQAETVKQEIFDEILAKYTLQVKVVPEMTYEGIAASDYCMVASGTATLETAILGTPMVILYKVSFLTWLYLKMVIKVPFIGLVNLMRGEKFIAEFVQYHARPRRIARHIINDLKDPQKLKRIKQQLAEVKATLGEPGASRRAAEIVIQHLKAK